MLFKFFIRLFNLTVLGFGFCFGLIQAQAASVYDQPPKEILDIMRAPSPPISNISPTMDQLLLVAMYDYPSIERVGLPFLRLAGVRLEPQNHSRHDTTGGYGIPACARSFSLVKVADGTEKMIDISKLACADMPSWSADGKHFFFINRTLSAVELWLGDVQTAKISRVAGASLNPMFGYEAQWMPNQKQILVKLIPENMGLAPRINSSPVGPSIQESAGQSGQSSTYEKRDTLNNKDDEKLFDYYGISQLALVDVQSKKITPLGTPAIFDRLRVAPDGIHILTTQIIRPYSYIVTYERFPKKVEVLDISKSKKISRNLIAELPLADRVPIHGVPTGPRDFSWNPHDSASLIWAEALDGGLQVAG